MTRTTSKRLKLPPVVTYVTRLPVPSSQEGTSVSFVNQSSSATHDRSSSSVAPTPSPQRIDRASADDTEAVVDTTAEPDGNQASTLVVGETNEPSSRPQHRRPSAIRSTLSCSQLPGLKDRRPPLLVTANSNPALLPRNGDDRQRDGPSAVSSALTRHIRSSRVSVRSAGELESVKNFYSLSAPTSMSSVRQHVDDWPNWRDWIVQPDMLRKLTQIEDEMDECLQSVDADNDDTDAASGLRRTCSDNVGSTSASCVSRVDGGRTTVAVSKSYHALSRRQAWKRRHHNVTPTDRCTSGSRQNGDAVLDVLPATSAPLLVTTVGTDMNKPSSCSLTEIKVLGPASADGTGLPGNYVTGLARSTSDVTSQRRFHRRRSAARCSSSLTPISRLDVYDSHLLAPRLGHSCSALGDSLPSSTVLSSHSGDLLQSVEKQLQPVPDELDVRREDGECVSVALSCQPGEVVETRLDGVSDSTSLLTDRARHSPAVESSLQVTSSVQSLDICVTVEVVDKEERDGEGDDGDAAVATQRSCISIPPVTISSPASSPDDEPTDRHCGVALTPATSPSTADRSSRSTSGLSSPAAMCHSSMASDKGSSPKLLSVSRSPSSRTVSPASTGYTRRRTMSSGGLTKSNSRRVSSHQSIVDVQDIISVDNGRGSETVAPGLQRQSTILSGRRRRASGLFCLSSGKCCRCVAHESYTNYMSVRVASRAESEAEIILSKRTTRNERKASKVLGIILLAFTLFWTPFFVVNIISVLCTSCFQQWFGDTDVATPVVWWGYVSSTANPIIYTLFSEAFRAAFCRILTCKPRGISVRRATSTRLGHAPLAATAPVVNNRKLVQEQEPRRLRSRHSNSFSFNASVRGSLS